MKRYFFITAIGFLLLFFLIHFSKTEISPDSESDLKNAQFSEGEREKIRQFWDFYRKATDFRLNGDWRSAASVYRQALELEPEHKDALYYSGNVLFELGEFDKAARAWRKLTQVNPLSKRAHVQLGTLYSCGVPDAPLELEKAEAEFKKSLEINKEESGTLLKLGGVYILMGKLDTAKKYLETALKINFKSVEAAYLLGYVNWRTADFLSAQKYFADAVRLGREKQSQPKTAPPDSTQRQIDLKRKSSGPVSFFSVNLANLINHSTKSAPENVMEREYAELAERIESTLSDNQRP
ncbi:MAG: tetratricopeptide repeat protein [FCB group bacterium]|nr:tetratricopeptide repeat protein [FCB group bacterium]